MSSLLRCLPPHHTLPTYTSIGVLDDWLCGYGMATDWVVAGWMWIVCKRNRSPGVCENKWCDALYVAAAAVAWTALCVIRKCFFLEAEENQSNSGRRLHVCNWAKNDLCSFDFPFKIICTGDLSETFLGYSGIAAFRSFCCVVHPLMLSNDVV